MEINLSDIYNWGRVKTFLLMPDGKSLNNSFVRYEASVLTQVILVGAAVEFIFSRILHTPFGYHAVFLSGLVLLHTRFIFYSNDRGKYAESGILPVIPFFHGWGNQPKAKRRISGNTPPSIIEYIAYLALPKEERESLLGCLEEEYSAVVKKFGKRRADIWYGLQVMLSVAPLLDAAFRRWFQIGLIGILALVTKHFGPSIKAIVLRFFDKF